MLPRLRRFSRVQLRDSKRNQHAVYLAPDGAWFRRRHAGSGSCQSTFVRASAHAQSRNCFAYLAWYCLQVLITCISSVMLIAKMWRTGGTAAMATIHETVPTFVSSWNELASAVGRTGDTSKAHAFAYHVVSDMKAYSCSLASSQGRCGGHVCCVHVMLSLIDMLLRGTMSCVCILHGHWQYP